MPDTPEDDLLSFLDDDTDSSVPTLFKKPDPWRVLSVDDDEDVHVTTQLALNSVEILGKNVELLRAYSGQEALDVLSKEQGIAVVLLDVVMESDNAGLAIVDKIRNDLGLVDLRIVLRTGQPGYAPELDAIRDYDINDYRNKSELTHTKLYATLTSAIRSYSQIRALEASRKGLELIAHSSGELINSNGFDAFALRIINQLSDLLGLSDDGIVCTRAEGRNTDAGSDYMVISASGRYSRMANKKLCEINDARVQHSLEASIQKKSNVLQSDATVLYFLGQSGRNLVAFLDQTRHLDDTETRLLDVFCSNISVCLNNVLMLSKLHHYAYFDSLLDIPNRLAFAHCIEDWIKKDVSASVVLVDVDQFSAINDTIGTTNGDFLLGAVAQRLHDKLGDAFVARVSGDVFGLVGDREALSPDRVREIFYEPFTIVEQEQLISVTLGLYDLVGGEDAQESLKKANIALKKAKEFLRGSHCYFTREMEMETETRVRLLHNLRKAFDSDRLFMVYQPQVNVADGLPVGVEALLRWRTEEGEMVPPDRFIPLAESSGLIIHLGEWVMRTAMFQLKHFQKETKFKLRMGINVSMSQFKHPDFLSVLDRAISDSAVDPCQIELEITESIAMIGRLEVNRVLSAVADRGIKIAIDDFGTGFSSLSYLEQLKVHRLKIDKSFIDKLQGKAADTRLSEMIVNLAKDLDLEVIAEGVETEEQAGWLKKIQCTEAQGYLYARPLEPNWLIEWLREQEVRLAKLLISRDQ